MDLATMAHQKNRLLRDLVRDLRGDYAPASIRLFATVLQSVIDHPRDDNGVRLFKCDWNLDFADLPAVIPAQQKAPMIPTDELQAAVAHHELGLMFAILAGTGLRVGELLALQRADWNRAGAIITVRASKTQAGIREIDLPRVLNDRMLAGLPAARDRLFPHGTTYYRDRAENVTGAFHSMRRFRLTHLRTMGLPEDLISLAMGHANKTIGDRYSRVRLNKEFRREWTERAGLGFVL
jgi:integrase